MLEVKKVIKLESTTDTLIFETNYLVQVNFTFQLTYKSNGKTTSSHYCIRKDQIEALCNEIDNLSTNKTSKVIDNDSDAFFQFLNKTTNEIKVIGQVGGSFESNFEKFNFVIDNEILLKFKKQFKALLEFVDDIEYEKKYNKLYGN